MQMEAFYINRKIQNHIQEVSSLYHVYIMCHVYFTQFLLHETNFDFDEMKLFQVLLVCSQNFTDLHYLGI